MMRRLLPAMLCCAAAVRGDTRIPLDAFAYATTPDIRAAWKAPKGVPAPSMERRGDRTAAVFPLPFSRLATRGCWDRRGAFDLARAGWIELDFEVENPAAVASITLYLQSPPGWHAAQVPVRKGRSTARIPRLHFKPDDPAHAPGPWSRVTAIRIAPWKGAASDAVLRVFRLDAVAPDILVVSPASRAAAPPAETSLMDRAARDTCRAFDGAGLPAGLVADTQLDDALLAAARLVVFPYNPGLPPAAVEPLARFAARGGACMAFYQAPAPLADILGIRVTGWRKENAETLHAIAFAPGALEGLPARLTQNSGSCALFAAAAPRTRIVGSWQTRGAAAAGIDAVAHGPGGIFVGHILNCRNPDERNGFLRASAAAFIPGAWEAAARAALEHAGRIEQAGDPPGLERFLAARKAPAAAFDKIEEGRKLLAQARAVRRASEAPALAARAHAAFVQAMAHGFAPRKSELRAVWCHNAYGVEGLGWEEPMRALAGARFTAVFANMLWAGIADYKSAVLPVRERVARDGDQIARCLAAAAPHGIQVHVWKVCWNLAGAPPTFLAALKSAGRCQVDRSGATREWLCPSREENFALERDALLEVVRNYAVAGIHLDYIRYPDQSSCVCAACRAGFEKRIGAKVAAWPADVLGGAHRASFRQYRRDTITRLVRSVAMQARALRPGIKVSAAVFPDGSESRDGIAQDWRYWVSEGLLDFVCPMDYTPDRARLELDVRRQLAWAGGKAQVVPGLAPSVHPEDLAPEHLLWMIDDVRRLGAAGFALFELDHALLEQHLPLLAIGAAAPER
ncbi:MAG TPA: hypothetical protein DCM87_15770 [Planctomycetes bacterium]|nr:hypothetical protein [Planctomycetota bacterium]